MESRAMDEEAGDAMDLGATVKERGDLRMTMDCSGSGGAIGKVERFGISQGEELEKTRRGNVRKKIRCRE